MALAAVRPTKNTASGSKLADTVMVQRVDGTYADISFQNLRKHAQPGTCTVSELTDKIYSANGTIEGFEYTPAKTGVLILDILLHVSTDNISNFAMINVNVGGVVHTVDSVNMSSKLPRGNSTDDIRVGSYTMMINITDITKKVTLSISDLGSTKTHVHNNATDGVSTVVAIML